MDRKECIRKYVLWEHTTPEDLEMFQECYHRITSLCRYGKHIIVSGSYCIPKDDGTEGMFFGAVYDFTTEDDSSECPVHLVKVSDPEFRDDGHALLWGMNQCIDVT